MKLFLKGERCYSEKCAVTRRNYAPGQHGQRRPKPSEYGLQLREKQKVKRIYGVFERQEWHFGQADGTGIECHLQDGLAYPAFDPPVLGTREEKAIRDG